MKSRSYQAIALLLFSLIVLDWSSISQEDVKPVFSEPLGYWKFEEGEGDIIFDEAGNNDGTVHGANWTIGRFGTALEFDGLDDYVEIPSSPSLDSVERNNALTITFWLMPKDTGKRQDWICREGQWWLVGKRVPGGMRPQAAILGTGEGLGKYQACEHVAPFDEWTFIAMTWDGVTMKIYVDLNVTEFPLEGDMKATNSLLRIGDRPVHDFPTAGIIDEVRIYNIALGEEDIQALFEAREDQ